MTDAGGPWGAGEALATRAKKVVAAAVEVVFILIGVLECVVCVCV